MVARARFVVAEVERLARVHDLRLVLGAAGFAAAAAHRFAVARGRRRRGRDVLGVMSAATATT